MKLSRRDLIAAGVGVATVTLPLGRLALAADDIHMTTIPSTGQKVPSVGIGTVDFRGDPASSAMDPKRETLKIFHSMGGRLLDTSPNYGNSEQVLGTLLPELGLRDDVFMATKVDREDGAEGLERMESSFGRLGEPIDLMQIHNLRGTDVQMANMMDWKEKGRFRYIGITTHRVSQHDELEAAMRKYPLDFIQVNYSVADHAAADRILPLAMDKGIAVLVNRPFGDGKLFGAVKGQSLPQWASAMDISSWGQFFLKYVISHPAATIPIPGTTKPHHAEDNMGAMRGPMPDDESRIAMARVIEKLL